MKIEEAGLSLHFYDISGKPPPLITSTNPMPSPLLTSLDSEGHIHLIIGSNPLANARCAKSLEAGARPIIIAPANADIHYVLANRIEEGAVKWVKKTFEDSDLSSYGRDEVENVVDAVFITSGGKSISSGF